MRAVARAVALCLVACAVGACSRDDAKPLPARVDAPALRLIVVADLEAVLEPCGCGVRPAGGVDRLVAAVDRLRQPGQPTLVLAAGNWFFDPSARDDALRAAQDSWKADFVGNLLSRLGVDVLAPGARDLGRAASRVRSLVQTVHGLGVVGAADARAVGGSAGVQRTLGATQLQITSTPGDAATEPTAQQLAGRAGLRIAVTEADADPVGLAADFTNADLVVQVGARNDVAGVSALPNGSLLVHPGRHGEGLVALELWPAARGGRRFRIVHSPPTELPAAERVVRIDTVRLDAKAPRDPAMRSLLDQLFARINAHNASLASGVEAPSGVATKPHALLVGSETCAACHTPAYFAWRATAHARAFETLLARGRQYDLDCVSCHITSGDDPAAELAGVMQRKGVGCESCHGAGSLHADQPHARTPTIARAVPEARCVVCHDREHGRPFVYAEREAALRMPGHGAPLHGGGSSVVP